MNLDIITSKELELTKKCTKCNKIKTRADFHKNKTRVDGLLTNCKSCVSEHQKGINNPPPNDLTLAKKCTCCEELKRCSDFYKNKGAYDGLQTKCKSCIKKYQSKMDNSTPSNLNMNKICTSCKELKRCSDFNKHKQSSDGLNYHCRECTKEYARNNKERRNKRRRNKRQRNRYKNDPLYKLSCNIRNSIKESIKRKGYTKKSKTCEILGCSFEEFIIHLNDNVYNFFHEDGFFDLDHIIPISSATTEEEVYKLNHYTNFQLLPSVYNRNIKSDNDWDEEDFEKWLLENSNTLYEI